MMEPTGRLLEDYADACNRSTIGNRPVVWASHWDANGEKLGHIGVPKAAGPGVGRAVQAVLGPFTTCHEVAASVLVCDAQTDPIDRRRGVFVSQIRLTDDSVVVSHSVCEYSMGDRGELSFGDPLPSRSVPQPIFEPVARALVLRSAQAQRFGFDEAVQDSMAYLKMTDQGGT